MGRKSSGISMTALLQQFIITVEVVPLQEASLSDTENPKTVCEHIDSR